jgi:hypothetical protein
MFEKAQMLTSRYDEAFRYAHDLHRHQTRKGTDIPYISHLMIVSALVVEYGGNEDQAIGALLHDAAEDQGGQATLDEVRLRLVMPSPRSSKTARTPGSSQNRNGDRARRLISPFCLRSRHAPCSCHSPTRPTMPKPFCLTIALSESGCGRGSPVVRTAHDGPASR